MRQLLVPMMLCAAACAHAPDRVGQSSGLTLTHRFVSANGEEAEYAPGPLGGEVVEDQARIVTRDETQTCVELLLQTEAVYARPLADLEPVCMVGGRQVAGEVSPQESAETVELWYEVFDVTRLGWVPVVFRVEMRRGTVCCPGEALGTFELVLRNGAMGTPAYVWQGRWVSGESQGGL